MGRHSTAVARWPAIGRCRPGASDRPSIAGRRREASEEQTPGKAVSAWPAMGFWRGNGFGGGWFHGSWRNAGLPFRRMASRDRAWKHEPIGSNCGEYHARCATASPGIASWLSSCTAFAVSASGIGLISISLRRKLRGDPGHIPVAKQRVRWGLLRTLCTLLAMESPGSASVKRRDAGEGSSHVHIHHSHPWPYWPPSTSW